MSSGVVALPLWHLSLVPSWNQSSARHRGSPALSCEEGGTWQVLVRTEVLWSDLDVVPGSVKLSASLLAPFAVLCPLVGTETVAERPAGSSGCWRLSLFEVFLS